MPPLPPTPRPPRLSLRWLVVALYAGLGLAGIGLGALHGHANVFTLAGDAEALSKQRLILGIGLGLGTGAVMLLFWRWAVHALEWARQLRRDLRELLGVLLPDEIVVLAVTSALGEELFFRGALLPALGRGGLFTSSLVFALLHLGPLSRFPRMVPWTLSALVTGLCFGALFVATGNLCAPVLAHFLVNLVNLKMVTERPL